MLPLLLIIGAGALLLVTSQSAGGGAPVTDDAPPDPDAPDPGAPEGQEWGDPSQMDAGVLNEWNTSPYHDDLQTAADDNEVPAPLLAALISNESHFNPDAYND